MGVTAKAGDKTTESVIMVVTTLVAGITLNQISAFLKVEETVTLNATINLEDATNKTVRLTITTDTWISARILCKGLTC